MLTGFAVVELWFVVETVLEVATQLGDVSAKAPRDFHRHIAAGNIAIVGNRGRHGYKFV